MRVALAAFTVMMTMASDGQSRDLSSPMSLPPVGSIHDPFGSGMPAANNSYLAVPGRPVISSSNPFLVVMPQQQSRPLRRIPARRENYDASKSIAGAGGWSAICRTAEGYCEMKGQEQDYGKHCACANNGKSFEGFVDLR